MFRILASNLDRRAHWRHGPAIPGPAVYLNLAYPLTITVTALGSGTGPAPGRAGPKAKRRPRAVGSEKVVWVPVVGQVAAGEPIPPLESIQDRFPLPKEMVGAEEGLFILKVVHDSMIGVGIFPGDWV